MFSRKYVLFEETNNDVDKNNRTEQAEGNKRYPNVMREELVQEDVLRNDEQEKN
jgi:hypothetical protein